MWPTVLGMTMLAPTLMYSFYKDFTDDSYSPDGDILLWLNLYLILGFVTIPVTVIVGIPYLLSLYVK